jgi:hypothetical protein
VHEILVMSRDRPSYSVNSRTWTWYVASWGPTLPAYGGR